jgi:tellurite resistance protein TerC
MQAVLEIQWWHWVGFILSVLFFLALDLGVFHRRAHEVKFKEALTWTGIWVCLALGFAAALDPWRGEEAARQFLLGYLIELSLSMDNVFVIAVLFAYFRVPSQYQHRVLFWGILGALIMRGLMIWLGVELVRQYEWVLYIFGVFLVLTGVRMFLGGEEEVHPEKNPVLRLARKYFPVTPDYVGQQFLTRSNGRWVLTPMALVLLMVETTDLMFALDSIPAIFVVTRDPFIVFTSNVFAILGLRSLYFVLAGMIGYFQFLKYGLAVVLIFIGFKMLVMEWVEIPSRVSLLVVAGILLIAILSSVFYARRAARKTAEHDSAPTTGGS